MLLEVLARCAVLAWVGAPVQLERLDFFFFPVKNENIFTIAYNVVVRFVRQIDKGRRIDNRPVLYRYTIIRSDNECKEGWKALQMVRERPPRGAAPPRTPRGKSRLSMEGVICVVLQLHGGRT